MFLLLLLFCDDDDDDDFAIVTDEEEDDNFAIVVVFNVVLLTLPLLSPFCVNRVLFSFDAIGVVMVVTDNILVSYLLMRVRKCCLDMCVCVCVKISRRPGCERNWRSRWTAEKEAKKKQKKRGKETTNQRRKNTRRERQHTFNTISTTDTKKNVYEENSGGIARNNSAVSALCF